MLRSILLSKIHRATITQTDLEYVGSITIDAQLLEITGMKEFEKVEIFDLSNGNRFETYIIEGVYGSGEIGVNGAAARLVHRGDKIIIVNYAMMNEEEMRNHTPKVLTVDDNNQPLSEKIR
ncbi:MAG TPA: aspartate 1-decarboxylase [Candidatus Cloacimonadota bacterium]|nr:aspartate 1-decarboxylase [Candidatus Cloacimonadota bacterium]